MDESVVSHFMRLFRGRGDVRWSWATKRPEYGPVLRRHFEAHLCSPDPGDWIGTYPLLGHMASWGCVDIDNTDDPTTAFNLQGALRYKEVPAWVERTDHGYHVWVFPAEPLIAAETMRHALYAACAAIGYEPKEVNPKQADASRLTRGIGNLVRLPYNGAMAEVLDTRWFIDPTTRSSLGIGCLEMIDNRRAPYWALEAIAKLYTPPPKNVIDMGAVPPLSKQITDGMSGRTFTIYRDGPLPGSDRSGTMLRLAAACANDGLSPAETAAVLKGCWYNKYEGRPDEDDIIDDLIARVS